MSPKPFQGSSERQDLLQPYVRGCLYSCKSFDKNTPDRTPCYTECKYLAHSWQYKHLQTVFLGPWPCTKSAEFLTSGFAQLPRRKVFDKFLNTFYKYSLRGKSLQKASSKLPDGYIAPTISLSHYGWGNKTPKNQQQNQIKKPNL